jgi:hypothetical protein
VKGNSFGDTLAAYTNKDSRNKNHRCEQKGSEGSSKRAKTSSSNILDACADKWEQQQRQTSTVEDQSTILLQHSEQEQHPQDASSAHQYPAFPPSTGNALQDEALQGLLMAWYYSGYATGKYQAMLEMGAFALAPAESSAQQTGDNGDAAEESSAC